jgi:hypothetical protein
MFFIGFRNDQESSPGEDKHVQNLSEADVYMHDPKVADKCRLKVPSNLKMTCSNSTEKVANNIIVLPFHHQHPYPAYLS